MILQTARLLLRELTLADAAFILELVNSPNWLQFIGDRNIKTLGAAKEYLLNGPIKSYQENGFGLWLVELKSGVPIGMCGILKREPLERPEIGFALLPGHTSNGYGYEAAGATLKYASENLRLSVITAITVPHNVSSISLLEKIGMEYEREIIVNNEPLLLYSSNTYT